MKSCVLLVTKAVVHGTDASAKQTMDRLVEQPWQILDTAIFVDVLLSSLDHMASITGGSPKMVGLLWKIISKWMI